jgi:hypothetical protein
MYTNSHDSAHAKRKRALTRGALLIGVSGLLCASAQATFSIDAHVVAAGSSAQSTNPCFRLNATVGEPADGYMSSGTLSLNGGFRAIAANGTPSDEIFFTSFEACP